MSWKHLQKINRNIIKDTIKPLTMPPLPIFLPAKNPPKNEPIAKQIEATTGKYAALISIATVINDANKIDIKVIIIPINDENKYTNNNSFLLKLSFEFIATPPINNNYERKK